MKTLKNLFSKYGNPSDQMDIRIGLYFVRADKIRSMKEIQYADQRAMERIQELLEYAEALKEYRNTLYQRACELYSADYEMLLTIRREVHYTGKKSYTVTVQKVLQIPNAEPCTIFSQTFEGKERHKALKCFGELQKKYPNIKTEINIKKKFWEK